MFLLAHAPSGQARRQAFSENRYPARIKSGPSFSGVMLWSYCVISGRSRFTADRWFGLDRLDALGDYPGLEFGIIPLVWTLSMATRVSTEIGRAHVLTPVT